MHIPLTQSVILTILAPIFIPTYSAIGVPFVGDGLTHHPQELILIGYYPEALFQADFPRHVLHVQRVRESHHTVFFPSLHGRVDLVNLVVADQRANSGRPR